MLPVKPNLALPKGWEATVYAEHQDRYTPLPVVRSGDEERRVVSRWVLTPDECQKLVAGHDVYLTMLTYGEPLQPVLLSVGAPHLEEVEPAPSTRERIGAQATLDGLRALQERLKRIDVLNADGSRLNVVGTEGGKASLPVGAMPPSKAG